MWWLPLVAAVLNQVRSDNERKRGAQEQVDDTVSSIKEKNAAALGGEPYGMMAANGAVQAGRAQRAYEPPANAIGLAIQALSDEGGSTGAEDAPAPGAAAGAAQYKLDHSFSPTQYGDPNDLIDPWKRR